MRYFKIQTTLMQKIKFFFPNGNEISSPSHSGKGKHKQVSFRCSQDTELLNQHIVSTVEIRKIQVIDKDETMD